MMARVPSRLQEPPPLPTRLATSVCGEACPCCGRRCGRVPFHPGRCDFWVEPEKK